MPLPEIDQPVSQGGSRGRQDAVARRKKLNGSTPHSDLENDADARQRDDVLARRSGPSLILVGLLYKAAPFRVVVSFAGEIGDM